MIRDVAIFAHETILEASQSLRHSNPLPECPFPLDEEIRVDQLDLDLAIRIMDACEPSGLWRTRRPQRQWSPIYTFIRERPPLDPFYVWDSDQHLQNCIALSRLVHPTSMTFDYSARLSFDDSDLVEEIIPGPVYGPGSRAFVMPGHRDWLTAEDLLQLKTLLHAAPWTSLPDRLKKAFWYHEFASRLNGLDVRWTFVSMALEALVHTDRESSTRQFTLRVSKLAHECGVTEFSKSQAETAYDLRSRLAHGHGLTDIGATVGTDTLNLYQKMEEVLREVLKKAILNVSFAQLFSSDATVRTRWPLS